MYETKVNTEICGKCGRPGHESKECTFELDKLGYSIVNKKMCFRCGRAGHRQREDTYYHMSIKCRERYDANGKFIGSDDNVFASDDLKLYDASHNIVRPPSYVFTKVTYGMDSKFITTELTTFDWYDQLAGSYAVRFGSEVCSVIIPNEQIVLYYEYRLFGSIQSVINITKNKIRTVGATGNIKTVTIELDKLASAKHTKRSIFQSDILRFSFRDNAKSIDIYIPFTKLALYLEHYVNCEINRIHYGTKNECIVNPHPPYPIIHDE